MEQQPHIEMSPSMSPEERENIEFYQGWLRTALTEGLPGVAGLKALENQASFSPEEEEQLYERGFDMEAFFEAGQVADQLPAMIAEEVYYSERDLRTNIFKDELFKVKIRVGEDIFPVQSITAEGERILPIVFDEPYEGAIDDVLFDS